MKDSSSWKGFVERSTSDLGGVGAHAEMLGAKRGCLWVHAWLVIRDQEGW